MQCMRSHTHSTCTSKYSHAHSTRTFKYSHARVQACKHNADSICCCCCY